MSWAAGREPEPDVEPSAATGVEAASALARPGEIDPRPQLAELRAEFPRWAFLYDPWAGLWVAVCGRYRIQVAPTAAALRALLAVDHPTIRPLNRNGTPDDR